MSTTALSSPRSRSCRLSGVTPPILSEKVYSHINVRVIVVMVTCGAINKQRWSKTKTVTSSHFCSLFILTLCFHMWQKCDVTAAFTCTWWNFATVITGHLTLRTNCQLNVKNLTFFQKNCLFFFNKIAIGLWFVYFLLYSFCCSTTNENKAILRMLGKSTSSEHML